MPPRISYWADVLAHTIVEDRGLSHRVASGITPSGPIHLGNVREVLTADALLRALRDAGADSELLYIGDTFDPLRRVYPFLPDSYEEHIGRPLSMVPAPDGSDSSYADYFLEPFLAAMGQLGVDPTVYLVHELYRSGAYTEVVSEALGARAAIAEILEGTSGRKLPGDWWPFMPLCGSCGRITGAKVLGHNEAKHTVTYRCDCGHEGEADYSKGEGKLPWRVEWPARWKLFGVTVEPFGKDHAAAGGSYDTGSRLAEQVFGVAPPAPAVYEWIYLKGEGAMASSTGVAVSTEEMLSFLPPQVVRFLVLRSKIDKHIDFDPRTGFLQLVDEYQDIERAYFEGQTNALPARIYELSQTDGVSDQRPWQVPYLHLAISVQAAQGRTEGVAEILKRTGYEVPGVGELEGRVAQVRYWLDRFAPEEFKFEVTPDVPEEATRLSDEQKSFLARLSAELGQGLWRADAIHDSIHATATQAGLSAKKAFQAVYIALLGKTSGPRAGWFLASLDPATVCDRFGRVGGL